MRPLTNCIGYFNKYFNFIKFSRSPTIRSLYLFSSAPYKGTSVIRALDSFEISVFYNVKTTEERAVMMRSKLTKNYKKAVRYVAKKIAARDANTTCVYLAFQPQMRKEVEHLRKNNNIGWNCSMFNDEFCNCFCRNDSF